MLSGPQKPHPYIYKLLKTTKICWTEKRVANFSHCWIIGFLWWFPIFQFNTISNVNEIYKSPFNYPFVIIRVGFLLCNIWQYGTNYMFPSMQTLGMNMQISCLQNPICCYVVTILIRNIYKMGCLLQFHMKLQRFP